MRETTVIVARTLDGAEQAATRARGDAVSVVDEILGDEAQRLVQEQCDIDAVVVADVDDPRWVQRAIELVRPSVGPSNRLSVIVPAGATNTRDDLLDSISAGLAGWTVHGVGVEGAAVAIVAAPTSEAVPADLTRVSVDGAITLANMLATTLDPSAYDGEDFAYRSSLITAYLREIPCLHREVDRLTEELHATRSGMRARGNPDDQQRKPTVAELPGHEARRLTPHGDRLVRWGLLAAIAAAWTGAVVATALVFDLDASGVIGLSVLGATVANLLDHRRRAIQTQRRTKHQTVILEQNRARLSQLERRHAAALSASLDASKTAQATLNATAELRQDSERTRTALSSATESVKSEVLRSAPTIRRAVASDLMVTYRQIEASLALRDVVAVSGSTPPLRGWAASPDVIAFLISELHLLRPDVVVECGSGASTAWLAMACRTLGLDTKIVALEHDPRFAAETRTVLDGCGVSDIAEVRIATLRPCPLPTFDGSWYAIDALEGLAEVGLVFVDGPPATTAPMARFPALAMLHPHLAHRATIVLDDTIRQEERDIVSRWLEEFPEFSESLHNFEKGASVLRRGGARG